MLRSTSCGSAAQAVCGPHLPRGCTRTLRKGSWTAGVGWGADCFPPTLCAGLEGAWEGSGGDVSTGAGRRPLRRAGGSRAGGAAGLDRDGTRPCPPEDLRCAWGPTRSPLALRFAFVYIQHSAPWPLALPPRLHQCLEGLGRRAHLPPTSDSATRLRAACCRACGACFKVPWWLSTRKGCDNAHSCTFPSLLRGRRAAALRCGAAGRPGVPARRCLPAAGSGYCEQGPHTPEALRGPSRERAAGAPRSRRRLGRAGAPLGAFPNTEEGAPGNVPKHHPLIEKKKKRSHRELYLTYAYREGARSLTLGNCLRHETKSRPGHKRASRGTPRSQRGPRRCRLPVIYGPARRPPVAREPRPGCTARHYRPFPGRPGSQASRQWQAADPRPLSAPSSPHLPPGPGFAGGSAEGRGRLGSREYSALLASRLARPAHRQLQPQPFWSKPRQRASPATTHQSSGHDPRPPPAVLASPGPTQPHARPHAPPRPREPTARYTPSARPRLGLCRSQPLAAPFKRKPQPMAARWETGRGARATNGGAPSGGRGRARAAPRPPAGRPPARPPVRADLLPAQRRRAAAAAG
ncbi:basic salivary proline-rich protein 2-like [Manis pentadactyla]|uniref:basic salivary proline-rich protein 2-like n=1 Tax=Manis pentadactyla TaxID=143292 RepID=UPI00255C296E|nr:basic salivary proline-rich protein 2-like [Manis pentadactyla]